MKNSNKTTCLFCNKVCAIQKGNNTNKILFKHNASGDMSYYGKCVGISADRSFMLSYYQDQKTFALEQVAKSSLDEESKMRWLAMAELYNACLKHLEMSNQ